MKVADWLLALPREARIIVVAGGTTIAVALIFLLGAIAEYTLEGAQRIGATEPRVARLLGYESVSADLIAGAKRASIAPQQGLSCFIERRAGPLCNKTSGDLPRGGLIRARNWWYPRARGLAGFSAHCR